MPRSLVRGEERHLGIAPYGGNAWRPPGGKPMSVYYHLSVKTYSRARGQTASGAAAYRAGEKLRDYLGDTHDYRRKRGVLHREIVLPQDAPDWARDRQQLWAEADRAEKRKDSTIARECDIALPAELDEDARRRAAVALAQ